MPDPGFTDARRFFYFLFVLCFTLLSQPALSFARFSFSEKNASRTVEFSTPEAYFSALAAADSTTFEQNFVPDFRILLDSLRLNEFERLPTLRARKAYMVNYWKASNPNPLLPENLWLQQFLQRRSYALQYFSHPEPPFYDDRGKFYLKYGAPKFRYIDPGGPKKAAFFWDKLSQQVIRNRFTYLTYPSETWIYDNVINDFIVYFLQVGRVFKEVKDIYKFVDIGRKKENLQVKYWIWADLIKARAGYGHAMSEEAGKIRWLEDLLVHAGGLNRRTTLLADVQGSPETMLLQQARQLDLRIRKARGSAPSAALDVRPPDEILEFTPFISQFAGPEGNTRLEITFLVSINKRMKKDLKKLKTPALAFRFAALVRDSLFNPVAADSAAFTANTRWLRKQSYMVGWLGLTVSPGIKELTLQVRTIHGNRMGYMRRLITVSDFRPPITQLSDIQFLTAARRDGTPQQPVLMREGLPFTPYPDRRIKKSVPFYIFFELYQIRQAGLTNQYKVTYSVATVKDPGKTVFSDIKGLFSRKETIVLSAGFRRPVTGDRIGELLQIDTQNLKPGKYRLDVTVLDPEGDRPLASTSRLFSVEK